MTAPASPAARLREAAAVAPDAVADRALGEALAVWLESVAEHVQDGFLCCDNGAHQCPIVAPALAVADALLAAVGR